MTGIPSLAVRAIRATAVEVTMRHVLGTSQAAIRAAPLLLIDVDFHSSKKAMIESQKYSPYEMGLGRLVSLTKGRFIGQQALERLVAWLLGGLHGLLLSAGRAGCARREEAVDVLGGGR